MSARQRVRSLVIRGIERLPEQARQSVLSLGAEADEALLEILDDPALAPIEGLGGGYGPIHAMELLSLRGCLRAIPSFIRILLERADVEIAFDQALEGLSRFGPAALEPLLAARASANTELQKGRLDRALASLGCKDERIYVVLLEALARKDELAPASLARYGDSRALQPLMVALDQRDLEESSDVPLAAGFEVTELVGAIRALGGVLSAEQGARVARVTQESEAQVRDYVDRATQEEARRSLGRNDLCWCGSRKKYKKCHLREDEAQRERPN